MRRRFTQVEAISIDRNMHMELAWRRQLAAEKAVQSELQRGPDGQVWEVKDLAHLDRIFHVAGNRIVVLCAYSRSCGCCKRVLEHMDTMSKQVHRTFLCAPGSSHCCWP